MSEEDPAPMRHIVCIGTTGFAVLVTSFVLGAILFTMLSEPSLWMVLPPLGIAAGCWILVAAIELAEKAQRADRCRCPSCAVERWIRSTER